MNTLRKLEKTGNLKSFENLTGPDKGGNTAANVQLVNKPVQDKKDGETAKEEKEEVNLNSGAPTEIKPEETKTAALTRKNLATFNEKLPGSKPTESASNKNILNALASLRKPIKEEVKESMPQSARGAFPNALSFFQSQKNEEKQKLIKENKD